MTDYREAAAERRHWSFIILLIAGLFGFIAWNGARCSEHNHRVTAGWILHDTNHNGVEVWRQPVVGGWVEHKLDRSNGGIIGEPVFVRAKKKN